jgi:hypothetical protein
MLLVSLFSLSFPPSVQQVWLGRWEGCCLYPSDKRPIRLKLGGCVVWGIWCVVIRPEVSALIFWGCWGLGGGKGQRYLPGRTTVPVLMGRPCWDSDWASMGERARKRVRFVSLIDRHPRLVGSSVGVVDRICRKPQLLAPPKHSAAPFKVISTPVEPRRAKLPRPTYTHMPSHTHTQSRTRPHVHKPGGARTNTRVVS